MNDILNISSKNSYLTTKQWEKILQYVTEKRKEEKKSNYTNAKIVLENTVNEEVQNSPQLRMTYNLRRSSVNYIYFDLSQSDVTISASSYSGKDINGQSISGTHSDDNQYYIYQSNNGSYVYEDMINWKNTIVNNSDVTNVVENWLIQAAEVNKTPTNNRIHISGNGTYNITIDNIWSTYVPSTPASRTTGAIAYSPGATAGGELNFTFLNHNRIESFHIQNNSKGQKVTLTSPSNENTLTVIATKDKGNYWAAAIGNSDNASDLKNFYIEGGTIYAGTRIEDNCSAIGGGGNGIGQITISGGIVTAVASTSGTAIGGGIGYSSEGGKGEVTIIDGTVYAYNHCAYLPLDNTYYAVPSVAIGGGSSVKSVGNQGTVNISGGYVYAQSIGGAAIGGGGSTTKTGGKANVNISGGTVIAKSIRGMVSNGTDSIQILAGASIGGGTGATSGGDANITISGDAKVYTGSIGGGKATKENSPIGAAEVIIDGGTIQGQIIMSKGASSACSFIMNNGLIDNLNNQNIYLEDGINEVKEFAFIEGNGGAVFIQSGSATLNGGIIQNCQDFLKRSGFGDGGGAIFVNGGDFIMHGGTIQNCEGHNGGAVLVKNGNVIIEGLADNNRPYIYNNYARDGGGLMSWGAESKISIKNALICGNRTGGSGGGVYAYDNGSVEIYEDTIIAENQASNSGGGAASSGIMTIFGGSIQDNYSNSLGGGLFASNNIIFYNGKVNNNTSKQGGGFAVVGGDITIYDGIIDNNTSLENGGCIYINNGNYTMEGGQLNNNISEQSGGALFINGGNANINSGIISSNIALNTGGGISILDGSAYIGIVEDFDSHIHPVLENNIALEGGGLFINGGTTIMYCGKIRNNHTYEKTVNVYVANGDFKYNGGQIGINYDTGVFINGGEFKDESNEGKVKHELHYKNSLNGDIYNYKIPPSKWMASPKGDILSVVETDLTSPTWKDKFPEYEFVGWEDGGLINDKVYMLIANFEKK